MSIFSCRKKQVIERREPIKTHNNILLSFNNEVWKEFKKEALEEVKNNSGTEKRLAQNEKR